MISRLLGPNSISGRAVRVALERWRIITFDATMMELADVLSRRKFDPYVTVPERQMFLRLLLTVVDQVSVLSVIRACRDPEDDKFLELAVAGSPSAIVSGDADLLVLYPFRDIRIMTSGCFLAPYGGMFPQSPATVSGA